MKKKNEITRKSLNTLINTIRPDFCWVFLPNGDLVQLHEDSEYSQYLHEHYTSKSNEGL